MASFPIVFVVAPKGGNPSASSETAPSAVVLLSTSLSEVGVAEGHQLNWMDRWLPTGHDNEDGPSLQVLQPEHHSNYNRNTNRQWQWQSRHDHQDAIIDALTAQLGKEHGSTTTDCKIYEDVVPSKYYNRNTT